MRRWRSRHPDEHKSDGRVFYARHAEREIARSRAYQKEHPHVHRAVLQRRRARQLNSNGSYRAEEWRALLEEYGGRCAYCGQEATLLVPDHGLALKRGGSNSITNIFPACPPCNLHKYTLTVAQYRERRRSEGLHVRPVLPRELIEAEGSDGERAAPPRAPSRRRR